MNLILAWRRILKLSFSYELSKVHAGSSSPLQLSPVCYFQLQINEAVLACVRVFHLFLKVTAWLQNIVRPLGSKGEKFGAVQQQRNVSKDGSARGRCWAAPSLTCIVLFSVMGSVFLDMFSACPSSWGGSEGQWCCTKLKGCRMSRTHLPLKPWWSACFAWLTWLLGGVREACKWCGAEWK